MMIATLAKVNYVQETGGGPVAANRVTPRTTMTEFEQLLARVRQGDPAAARQVVEEYAPAIRRAVRFRLQQPSLRRAFDSMDVCQSVLGSFFLRAALGQYDLNEPEDLVRLLVRMARNKFIDQVRRAKHQPEGWASGVAWLASSEPSPSRQLAAAEFLRAAQARFSPDERQLLDLRLAGRTWDEVAAELGGTAEGRRKQHARTLERIEEELGSSFPSHA